MSHDEHTRQKPGSGKKRQPIPHDQIFKTLFGQFLQDLVELLDPDLAADLDLSAPTFLRDESFTDQPRGRRAAADLVAEAQTRDGESRIVLVHVETEGKFRKTIDRRTWRYAMHLALEYDQPVISIVVFLKGGTPGVHRREVVEKVGAFEVNRFGYLAFGLSGSLAEDYVDRPQPLAAALAALMRSKVWDNAERKLRCLKAVGRAKVNDTQRFLLANVVETYLKLRPEEKERFAAEMHRDANKEVREMVITWEDALAAREAKGMETGLLQGIQQGREQGIQQGREQGLEQGREQGIQQGIQEGEAAVLRRQLLRRFSDLPAWAEERLEHAGREELEGWAERVLDARRLEDVFGSE